MSEQVELSLRLGRGREQRMQLLGKDVFPIWNVRELISLKN
jgi:hypothetical protein